MVLQNLRVSSAIAACFAQMLCGCGDSLPQRWSDMPREERERKVAENFAGGEIYVAPLRGDSPATDALPRGKSYRAYGELRFKDPKASMLGAVIVQLFKLKDDGKEALRDQTTECNLEEVQPGVYEFTAYLDPIAESGKYSIRVKELGDPFAIGEFTVE